MQKITTFLWFNDNAQQAVKFYISIFKNSKITHTSYRPASVAKHTNQPTGSVLAISFKLHGQNFVAMNGGPEVKFNQAISLMVECDTQAELDHYWKKLTPGGGKEIACGWLQDKFGLSWQVTPEILLDPKIRKNKEKSDRMFQAMLKMEKLNVAKLKAAYDGK
jgi:predicted 3-demethylubiquinone-9 3-methyltransferase (glyoxalase superfamily)